MKNKTMPTNYDLKLRSSTIELNNPHSLQETCREIIRFAIKISKADYCTLAIMNPINNCIIRAYTQNAETMKEYEPFFQEKISLEQVYQKLLNRTDVSSINLNSENNDYYKDLFSISGQIKSLVALKLLTPRSEHQKMLGQLYLGYKNQCRNIDLEKEIAKTIAKEASSALQHTWSIRRYKDVAKIGQEINKELKSPNQIFKQLIKHLPKILDSSYFFMIVVYAQKANYLDYYMLENGVEKKITKEPDGACAYVINKQKPRSIENYEAQRPELEKEGIHIVPLDKTEQIIPDSMLFVPLNIRGTTLGVLSVQKKQISAFDSEDKQILELLSHYLALAISNVRWKKGFEDLIATGQKLTQELDVVNSMQDVVHLIRKQTKADIVALHPYDHNVGTFKFPVIYSGQLIDKEFPKPDITLPDDSATLGLGYGKPIFCESSELYKLLKGDVEKRGGSFEVREKIKSVAMLPLQSGGKPVGVLFLNFRQKQLFTQSQKNLIKGLGIFVSIAIINSKVFQESKQRIISNSEALRKIDQKIIETNNRKDIFDTILLATKENLQNIGKGKVHGTILIYDEGKNALIVESHLGENEKIRLRKLINLADKKGLTYHAWNDQTTIRVGNVKEDKRYLLIDQNTKSEMDTPVIKQGRAIGVISFESNQENFFTDADEEFLKTVSNQVVVSIEKTEAFENEKKAKQNELAIGTVAKKIIEDQLNFEQVVESILDKSLELTKYDAGAILLYDKDRKDFYIGAGRNIKPEKQSARLPENDGLSGLVRKNGKSLIANVKQSPYKEIYQPWIKGVEWALVVPIHKGKLKPFIGVIAIEGKREFTKQDKRLLEELADLAVIAFENAKNYEKVNDAVKTLKILNETGEQLGKIVEIDSLETAYLTVGKKLQKERRVQVVIRRYEMDTQKLNRVWYAKKHVPAPFEAIDITEDEVISNAFQTKKTLIIPDTENPPRGMKLKLYDPKIKSLVIVWVTFQDRNYGSISLSDHQNDYFQDIDLKLIEGLAQLLGLTIYRLEAEQKSRELEVFASASYIAGNLAHDILGVIGAIPSQYELLIKDLNNNQVGEAEKNDFLEAIILDLGKIERRCSETMDNFVTAEIKLLDTKTLIDDIKSSELVKNPNITLIWNIGRNLAKVKIVQSQIFYIIQSLVNNSVDELSNGGEITISAIRQNNSINISVSDTGKGIPPENKEKIFKKDFTTKNSTGYGLWISRHYAKNHNGKLRVDNNKQGGAIFTLTLPVSIS